MKQPDRTVSGHTDIAVALFYAVRDGIPCLLIDEAISIDQLETSSHNGAREE